MNATLISTHRDCLRQIYAQHLRWGSPYALVDFPDHANVGDSAIWLGELVLLRAITGRDPSYVSAWHDFDRDAFLHSCPDGPVLIHGGGNLGDLWSHHQRFRESLLTAFPDRTIVQLPQSIFFRDGGAADVIAQALHVDKLRQPGCVVQGDMGHSGPPPKLLNMLCLCGIPVNGCLEKYLTLISDCQGRVWRRYRGA